MTIKDVKTVSGVIIMKNGKAWGTIYKDSQCEAYGWIDPIKAKVLDPLCCKRPTDATYKGGPYIRELESAKLVHVIQTVETTLTFTEPSAG